MRDRYFLYRFGFFLRKGDGGKVGEGSRVGRWLAEVELGLEFVFFGFFLMSFNVVFFVVIV